MFGLVSIELSWADLIFHDPGEFELHYLFNDWISSLASDGKNYKDQTPRGHVELNLPDKILM